MSDHIESFRDQEAKWLSLWDSLDLNKPDGAAVREGRKEKRYALTMFPYPSGDLHMGHAEVMALHDATARYWRLKGYEVLNPMGWDSFGLPAENAAIKSGEHPARYTYGNIETQYQSFRRFGTTFDWSRRFHTSDEEYYRWTQWIFLQLYRAGLAERRQAPVNWCPTDQTVLANEQVVDGRCERCETEVIHRNLNQWYFTIKPYAQRLLDDMEQLEDKWPSAVLNRQRAWIGRSEGASVRFKLDTSESLEVYTTRPDTIYGATFLVVAADSGLAVRINRNPALDDYRQQVSKASDIERLTKRRAKTGVSLGVSAIHPLTGQAIPVYASDYVLADHGTGAIMGVPAHDERDRDFAETHGLPVVSVVGKDGRYRNSPGVDGMASEAEAIAEAVRQLQEVQGGEIQVNYRLRDWLVSRQRYWGAPIPIVHCGKCGEVPVLESDLPLRLPDLQGEQLVQKGKSPLAGADFWVNTVCPNCDGAALRDTDTMDTFVDSSWYFLRYLSAGRDDCAWDDEDVATWGPVDQYMGGAEHSTGHLMYSRFMTKALYDLNLVPFTEPFSSLVTQGVVVNEGERMRKSKVNGVALGEQLELFGVDAVRLALVFAGPPEDNVDWALVSPGKSRKFLERALRLARDVKSGVGVDVATGNEDLRRVTHRVRAEAGHAMEKNHGHVMIARVMELVSATRKAIDAGLGSDSAVREAAETCSILLSLVCPFTAESMWESLGHDPTVSQASWPEPDPSLLTVESVTCVVQVNGKVKYRLQVSPDISEEDLSVLALAEANLSSAPARVVMKAPRFVNFVV